jgi:hypothetical protein
MIEEAVRGGGPRRRGRGRRRQTGLLPEYAGCKTFKFHGKKTVALVFYTMRASICCPRV